jgi:predicted nucleic acid-binding protein
MFPDNTVLINFAIINRMDLLERLTNGNGRWCITVAKECAASARRPELAALDDARNIFGDPLFPDAVENLDVRVLRDELAGPGDAPTAHLGEAETLAIIVRRRLASSSFFVTDDREAARVASQKRVATVGTWALLRVAHKKAWVDADTLWGYVQTIKGQGRKGPPGVLDRASFDKWLAS